jgi:RsiW-degrading membrane proteinase PrsW (M82 family)
MEQRLCCVCGKPVAGDALRIGGRTYCQEHYAKVGRDRASVWRTCFVAVGVLVVFTILIAIIARVLEPQFDGFLLVLTGVALALVPALLWLVFFYLQDVLEPEPKAYVLGVFVLGALLASAVGTSVIHEVFHVQDWLGTSLLANLLGSILVIGLVQEFLKYVAVRYSIYLLPEFDERMDGILYGTAAGLGYATMLNIRYVVDSGGVDLEMGIIRIVVTALAQAAFAGITGYFLARAKFDDRPIWWLPLGLACAAVLNGLFTVFRGELTRMGSVVGGRTASPWLGLALATVVAVLTLLVLFYLMGRANRAEVAGGQEA